MTGTTENFSWPDRCAAQGRREDPHRLGGSVLFEHALTACADYTLCDRAGRLMAVIEAKRAHTPWLVSLSALRARSGQ